MLSNVAWYLYTHLTLFVRLHPLAFAAAALAGLALVHCAGKSLRAR